MKFSNVKPAVLFSLTLVSATTVLAKPEPHPIITESGIAIVPFLNLSAGYNDNIAKSDSNFDRSSFSIVEPGVSVAFEPTGQKHVAVYRLQRGDFFSSSKDNFTDHFFDWSSQWDLHSKHKVNLNYSLALAHESRGDNEETLNLLYNKYHSTQVNIGYIYGGDNSKGKLETNLGWGELDYKNNQQVTQYQSWEELRFNSTFYYDALPKTSLLFQIIANDRTYDLTAPGSSSKDSKHYFTYLGTSWDATEKLQGSAKLGAQYKNFDSSLRDDFKSFSWDINVTYLIRSYSAIQLITNRRSMDADGIGNAIDAKNYNVNWVHNWNQKVSTKAEISRLDEDYIGSARKDETTNLTLNFDYDFRRWLTLRLGYGIESKDSNINTMNYDQNIYYLAIEGVM